MSETPHSRLEHFPVTLFAIGMGLFGLTLAVTAAQAAVAVPGWLRLGLLSLSGLIVAGIALGYLAKAIRYPGAVRQEWNHPVKIAFFPAITITLLLVSAALLSVHPGVAVVVWWIAVIGQGALTLAVISSWISHRSFEVGHLTPAWFIPAVGNVVAPVGGAQMGFIETSWLFFSAGMLFWGVLLTLVMNRLVFHDPIPARLFPTMVILIAPPSVGFVAYVHMVGEVDGFARGLINAGYIFAALVVVQVPKLARLPFALSWWALSFPLAALTIASFMFGAMEGSTVHSRIGLVLLVILTGVVAGLVFRTALAARRGQICVPE